MPFVDNSRQLTANCFMCMDRKILIVDDEVDIREIINGERKSENMNDEVKETILAVADYADKQKKQAVLRAIIMFALEMLCCGFTIASIILIERSDVKISLWFAAIPLAMTIAYSVLLVINAKSYIRKVQKER